MHSPQASLHPRPFSTYYYQGLRANPQDWSRIGRASSLRGALRAAVSHLYDGTADKATIYGENGVALAHLTHKPTGIHILGVFHGQG
jgi:hypothetical protein